MNKDLMFSSKTPEIKYLIDSIDKGYVSYSDIRRALDEEHGTAAACWISCTP